MEKVTAVPPNAGVGEQEGKDVAIGEGTLPP
jgi:hypothetical protein